MAKVYPRGTRQGVYANLYYLSGINDAGYAVGRKSRYGLVGSAAFLTTPSFQDVTFLPIPSGGSAVAINNFNQVVGTNGESHAYLYNQVTGVYTKLLLSNDPSQRPGSNQPPVAVVEADVTSGRAPLTVTFSRFG